MNENKKMNDFSDEENNEKSEQKKNNNEPLKPGNRDLLRRRRIPGSPGSSNGKQKNGWPLGHRVAFTLLLVILGLLLWKQMNPESTTQITISYSEFYDLLSAGKIQKVTIQNSILDGTLTEKVTFDRPGVSRAHDHITVNIGNYDNAFIKELIDKKVKVTIKSEKTWVNILVSTLPWIFILAFWLFFMRQMQGGPKGVFTFGKSKAKLMADNQQKVTFADVAGVNEAKVELEEIIEFLKEPGKFKKLGGKIPKGALLVGPPGTGKTLLARAVAGEAGVPFFSMSGSDFVEMFVGVGASRVRDLFEQGKSNAPCIIFIDEIDAVGRQRGAGIGGGHDEREQTLNQLLVEMDGFETNDGVILLAATNRPDILDPALLRPGRFDRQIVVDWPDVKAREEILNVHAKKIKIGPDIDLKSVAKGTPGMTGADLANVVNEAALLAARLNKKRVGMADFEEAKDKVMMGTARTSLVITDSEKRLTAYHEAGHALVGKSIPEADPIHKVSIVARGRALGLTYVLPADEKHNWSYNYCIGKLTFMLGGRAAEYIKFGDVTNGASNDIETATNIARKMVCEWGMSKRLGPLAFGKKEHEIFLGREFATHKDYSEETAVAIDQEIRKIIELCLQQAETIIRENIEKLEALTNELLKKEILNGDEINRIFNSTHSKRIKPPRNRKRFDRTTYNVPKNVEDSHISVSDTHENLKTENVSEKTTEVINKEPVPEENLINVAKPGQKENIENSAEVSLSEKISSPDEKEKIDNKNEKQKKSSDFNLRRSKIIRLKIGGRRRVIQKTPAQKIRKIN